MAIRVYKPTSPARRFMSVLTFEEVTKTTPEKSLLESKKKNAGAADHGVAGLQVARTAAAKARARSACPRLSPRGASRRSA